LSLSGSVLYSQISPGDLTGYHAYLEGISNCTQCHDLGDKVSNKKCIDCHTDIKNRVAINKGYHSSQEVRSKDCIKCHSEHHGRNYKIVKFEKEKFDHTLTGFTLLGKHKEQKCENCHKAEYIQKPEIKKKKFTYQGLNESCITCHKEVHSPSLGQACESCHTSDAFKPATKYNHDRSKFKLTGQHIKVDCVKCHTKVQTDEKKIPVFKGYKFDGCIQCHKDQHEGKYGLKCDDCHVTTSFHQIKNKEKFDHTKTNYPLEGKHKIVKCESCHKNDLGSKPKHEKCIDCHTDKHNGQIMDGLVPKDCSNCHTVQGYKPTHFNIESHNKSAFPLFGSHQAVPCSDCHTKEKQTTFKFASLDCKQCHESPHGATLINRFGPQSECSVCHNSESWSDVFFDHSATKFRLRGAHKKVDCKACHYVKNDIGGVTHRFAGTPKSCNSCHVDTNHVGQFQKDGITLCDNCHNHRSWKINNFDHSKTEFALDGSHKDLECNSCHKPYPDNPGIIRYKIGAYKCSDCHSQYQ